MKPWPDYMEPVDPEDHSVGVLLALLVSPRASRTQMGKPHDGRLKISVTAPPVDGKANVEVVKFLSKLCGVSKSSISIVSGDTSKRKLLRIESVSVADMIAVCGA